MIYIARITNGIVTQVIVAWEHADIPADCVTIGPQNTVGIGWRYEGGEFIAPEPLFDPEDE